MKDIKEKLHRESHRTCSWMGRTGSLKMSIAPQAAYGCNTIAVSKSQQGSKGNMTGGFKSSRGKSF